MNKKIVGSRELKTRLGTYLRQVQKGQTLVVTDRGRPVAELTPVAVKGNDEERRLEELVVVGVLSRESNNPLARIRSLASNGEELSRAIVEDRRDRF